MDDVVQQLESAIISDKGESHFESYYKNRGRTGNQDERRKELLETQKDGRNYKIDKNRGILELVQAVDHNIFRTPKTNWRPSVYVSGFQEVSNFSNVLMNSEWLLEKPQDFAENWLVVACPKGVRMLVIAYKGTTKCFNKYGSLRFEKRTALPGGNPCEIKSKHNTCVLDCFYAKETNTMYVLDILAWNNCVMTEGEAAFRQYWILNHLETIPELKLITKKNQMIFQVIPKLPCTTESLNKFLSIFPYYNNNQPAVDGLLFYHSKAQYMSGETPLVGWLYPHMLPEVLGEDIKIHKAYSLERPENYVDYLDFIQKFEQKSSRIKQKRVLSARNSQGNAQVGNPTAGDKNMETDNNAQVPQGDIVASPDNDAKESNKHVTVMESEAIEKSEVDKSGMESMVANIVTEEK